MPAAGDYVIRIAGSGRIAANWNYAFDFSSSTDGWTQNSGQHPYSESGSTGFGNITNGSGTELESLDIQIDVNRYVDNLNLTFFGIAVGSNYLKIYNGESLIYNAGFGDGAFFLSVDAFVTTLRIDASRSWGFGLSNASLNGIGTNPFGENSDGTHDVTYADAIYYSDDDWITTQQAPNTTFLYLDAAAIPELAALPYNSNHVYEAVISWAGGTMNWSFTDSYDSEYSLNTGTLRVEIIPV